MISIQTHPHLYQKNHSASLEFAKSLIPHRTKEKMQFHLYWRVPQEVNEKHLTCLKSIVANHEDFNSGNYEINLWSNIDLSKNEILKPVQPFVNHRIWNPLDELRETPLEDHASYFRSIILDDDLCWLGGDMFRILCLYKYGGFYVDMDALILRDMSPLHGLHFVYQWGECGANPNAPSPLGGISRDVMYCNGAITGLQKQSETTYRFVEQLRIIPPSSNSVCWGCYLYTKITDPNLYRLPCAWFNIELLGNNAHRKFDWAFENGDIPHEPHDGCFSWHWHGSRRWDIPVQKGSKFDILCQEIDTKFDRIAGNHT